jgi:hypothetical protein
MLNTMAFSPYVAPLRQPAFGQKQEVAPELSEAELQAEAERQEKHQKLFGNHDAGRFNWQIHDWGSVEIQPALQGGKAFREVGNSRSRDESHT